MKYSIHVLTLLLALMLSACATTQNHFDPIESTNRVSDTINDGIDRVSLKPAAQGYSAIVPKPMRLAVTNFFDNSTYLNTVLNDFLQGKGGQGAQDFLRFLINSTLGIGGLVDVASSMGLDRHQEDFGQTLATWGFSQGAYLVYPLLGPNSVRDTPDILTATATDPLFWAGFALAPYITIPVAVLKYIDERALLLEASDMRDELALDPYVFTREAWRQNRQYKIYDGHPPTPESDSDDGWEEDDFDTGDSFDSSENIEPEGTTEPMRAESITAESAPIATIKTETIKTETIKAKSKKTEAIKTSPAHTATANKNSTTTDTSLKTRIHLSNAPDQAFSSTASMPSNHEPAMHRSRSDHSMAPSKNTSYVIYLSSHYSEVEAAAEQGQIAKQGIQTTITPVVLNQHTWYRLRDVSAYSDKSEAYAQLESLKSRTRLNDGWLAIEKR